MSYYFDYFKDDKKIENDYLKNYDDRFSSIINSLKQAERFKQKLLESNNAEEYFPTIYSPFFQYCFNNKAPIFKLENSELLEMMEDTELPSTPFRNINLPFEDFVLNFKYKGFEVELCVNKIEQDSRVLANRFNLEEGEPYYIVHGFMYKKGGKHISSTAELNFSTITVDMDFDENNKDLMIAIYKIARNILIYISTPQAKEHIKTKRSAILKNVAKNFSKKTPKKSVVTKLFTNVKYSYINEKHDANSSKKRPHLRKGHFRQQPYGKKDEEKIVKTIFVAPSFVNSQSSEEIPTKTIIINKKG